ncbi:MAG: hypothetical protein AAFV80_00895, partial [Bacteroidota bacterium]
MEKELIFIKSSDRVSSFIMKGIKFFIVSIFILVIVGACNQKKQYIFDDLILLDSTCLKFELEKIIGYDSDSLILTVQNNSPFNLYVPSGFLSIELNCDSNDSPYNGGVYIGEDGVNLLDFGISYKRISKKGISIYKDEICKTSNSFTLLYAFFPAREIQSKKNNVEIENSFAT